MAELTIRTAANCLMGKEIREQLQSNVAKLFAHLDAGLAPINLFFSWLPLPVYINRDRAQIEMANLFKRIIHDRRKAGIRDEHDILQGLMASKYKDGTALPDSEVAGLMISALMGGQHTSSTTTSWILFELAQRPDVVYFDYKIDESCAKSNRWYLQELQTRQLTSFHPLLTKSRSGIWCFWIVL